MCVGVCACVVHRCVYVCMGQGPNELRVQTFVKGARGFLKPLKHTACGCNTNRKRPSVIVCIL